MTTKMEDNQNGRRPKWKTAKMEDDQNEKDTNGIQPDYKNRSAFSINQLDKISN